MDIGGREGGGEGGGGGRIGGRRWNGKACNLHQRVIVKK